MTKESTERAQDKRRMGELNKVSGALYDLRPTASIAVPVGATVAWVEVYRLQPRSPDVLHDVLQQLGDVERRFATELALPMVGWRAPLANWWHRRRLKLLSRCVDALLRQVTGEQAVLIRYRGMPALAVQVAKVKLAAVALAAAVED
ncbi:hypothetical protein ACQVRX_01580 [Ralstonia pseudosolanacearum]